MHAVVDVLGVRAEDVHVEALALGIESMPLPAYYSPNTGLNSGPNSGSNSGSDSAPGARPNALLLGFGAVTPAAIRAGVSRLARAAESARTRKVNN